MTQCESKCPVCSENTSGTLPYSIYYKDIKDKPGTPLKRISVFACNEHDRTVRSRVWRENYLSQLLGPESDTKEVCDVYDYERKQAINA